MILRRLASGQLLLDVVMVCHSIVGNDGISCNRVCMALWHRPGCDIAMFFIEHSTKPSIYIYCRKNSTNAIIAIACP